MWSAFPDWTHQQVRDYLLSNAIDLGPPGPDNAFGYGRLSLPEPGNETEEVKISVNSAREVTHEEATGYIAGKKKPLKDLTPEIMADAAHAILTKSSRECSGNFFIDDDVLKAEGISDFSGYAVDPNAELMPDFFV